MRTLILEKKGLRSYLDRSDDERSQDAGLFRDFTPSLQKIIDECLGTMGGDGVSIQWSKTPQYRCTCDVERVWRTLRMLPLDDVREIIRDNGDVEVRTFVNICRYLIIASCLHELTLCLITHAIVLWMKQTIRQTH